MWRSVWEFIKESPMSVPFGVHAFRHPTCWIWPKIGKNRPKCKSDTNTSSSLSTCFYTPNMLNLAQNWQKCPKCMKIVWRVCDIVWSGVWKCVKVVTLSFSVQVHAFRYPKCWIRPNIGRNRPKCVKSVWDCVNKCVRVLPMSFPVWVHAFWHPKC